MDETAPEPERGGLGRYRIFVPFVAFAIALGVIFHVGISDALWGPAGEEHVAALARDLETQGYRRVTDPTTVGSFLV